MDSWIKYCPDYHIVEWNESNYDLSSAPHYVRQAYAAKKWAFVTDYVRIQIIYENGGVYLDTDIELLRSIDDKLNNSAYFGLQKDMKINTGLGFGSEKGSTILRELMQSYQDIPFLLPDGSMDMLPCPDRNTAIFLQHGLICKDIEQMLEGGIHIFPSEYFSPKDFFTGKLDITKNTYSIHHFAESWRSKGQRLMLKKKRMYINKHGEEEGKRRLKKWIKRHPLSLPILYHGWKGAFDRLLKSLNQSHAAKK